MIRPEIAIWLYGSYARGTSDKYSDLDILMICNDPNYMNDNTWNNLIPFRNVSPSFYTWEEIEGMSKYGSIFLHHLNKEARPMFETEDVKGRLSAILNNLCPYKRAGQDIESFHAVLSDVEESIKNDCSLYYELNVIGTVLRHSCILGCYLGGFQTYGRSDPIETFITKWDLDPQIAIDFNKLYTFRLYYQRKNCVIPTVTLDYVSLWCNRLNSVLNSLKEQLNAYERELLESDKQS